MRSYTSRQPVLMPMSTFVRWGTAVSVGSGKDGRCARQLFVLLPNVFGATVPEYWKWIGSSRVGL